MDSREPWEKLQEEGILHTATGGTFLRKILSYTSIHYVKHYAGHFIYLITQAPIPFRSINILYTDLGKSSNFPKKGI